MSTDTSKITALGREEESSTIREFELYCDVSLPRDVVEYSLDWDGQSQAVHKPGGRGDARYSVKTALRL